jgi:hypothetical protein
MEKRLIALAVMAAACTAAVPAETFHLEPICEGPALKGLRGTVPSAGPVTIYIPAGICEGRRPASSVT